MSDAPAVGVLENGQKVLMQQPFPDKKVLETKYYHCTRLHHKFVRADGKSLEFNWGVLATDNYYDQKYLDEEIINKNPYIREATPVEIDAYNMRVDPKGTISAQLRPQIEEEVRAQLDFEMKAEIQRKVAEGKIALTDEQIAALFEKTDRDAEILGEVDLGDSRHLEGIKSGSAKLTPTQPARLQGIMNTKQVPTGVSGK